MILSSFAYGWENRISSEAQDGFRGDYHMSGVRTRDCPVQSTLYLSNPILVLTQESHPNSLVCIDSKYIYEPHWRFVDGFCRSVINSLQKEDMWSADFMWHLTIIAIGTTCDPVVFTSHTLSTMTSKFSLTFERDSWSSTASCWCRILSIISGPFGICSHLLFVPNMTILQYSVLSSIFDYMEKVFRWFPWACPCANRLEWGKRLNAFWSRAVIRTRCSEAASSNSEEV